MIIDINKNVFVGHENGLFEEENNVWILIYVCVKVDVISKWYTCVNRY